MLTERDFIEFINSGKHNPPSLLYKFTTLDAAESILSTKSLRFQSPLRYNDPFDSQWDFLWAVHTREARQAQADLLEKALRHPAFWPYDMNPKFRDAIIDERKKLSRMPIRKAHARIRHLKKSVLRIFVHPAFKLRITDIRRRMRICCFTEKDESILMWSHYADGHRGVVLGFDVRELEMGLKCPVEQVEYVERPPNLIDVDAWVAAAVFGLPTPDLQGPQRRWALVKSKDWAHESEWRIVAIAPRGTRGDYHDCKFPVNALKKVIFGCNSNRQLTAKLGEMAKSIQQTVVVEHLERNSDRYELRRAV